MATKSLKARHNALADTNKQMEILENGIFAEGELPYFRDKIAETGQFPLRPRKLEPERPTDGPGSPNLAATVASPARRGAPPGDRTLPC